MKPGTKVIFDDKVYEVVDFGPREKFEKLASVRLLGNGLVIKGHGHEFYVLEFEVDEVTEHQE